MPASAASGGSCIGGEGYGQNEGVPDVVELTDGAPVVIRPVTGEDRRLLLSGFARFGDRSREQRFMGVKVNLTEAELAFFTEVDQHDHVALGALACRAEEEGVEHFQATVKAGNRAMLRGFARIGEVEVIGRDLDTMEICVRLPVRDCL
jgi:hypothetical protein